MVENFARVALVGLLTKCLSKGIDPLAKDERVKGYENLKDRR